MGIDLFAVSKAAWRHKAALISVFVGAFALVWCVYFNAAPRFEASSLLLAQLDPPLQVGSEARTNAILRQDQFLNSEVEILRTQEVVRAAIRAVGLQRLLVNEKAGWQFEMIGALKWIEAIIQIYTPLPLVDVAKASSDALAYEVLAPAIVVRNEPRTDLIKVSFQHRDPRVASEFVKALVDSFLEREAQLSNNPAAAKFVQSQQAIFNAALEGASHRLSEFSRKYAIYSIEDQRKLLLARQSELVSAMAGRRTDIAGKRAQAVEIANQLSKLKLTTNSPQIASLARGVSGGGQTAPPQDAGSQFIAGDPPLLLVRVYQDTVQALVRTNSELAAARAGNNQQQVELEDLTTELAALVDKQADFDKLRSEVQLARLNVETFSKKTVEQDLDAALIAQKFSRIRVVQEAVSSLLPVYPKRSAFLLISISVGGVAAGLLAVLFAYKHARRERLATE